MSSRRERWREYEQQWLRKYAMQRRLARIFKQDDEPDDGDDDAIDDDRLDGDNGDNGTGPRHVVDELADLLVEGGSHDGPIDRQTALQWLLHSERGQALVTRMAQARKRATNRKDFQMTRSEVLRSIVKRHNGIAGLCKHIVAKGAADVTEAELTGMITATAKAEYPHLTSEAAFSKMFCGPDGETLRRAMQVAMFTQLYGR
jgi:hypothetical protein